MKVKIIRWEWPEKTLLWATAAMSAANLALVVVILLNK